MSRAGEKISDIPTSEVEPSGNLPDNFDDVLDHMRFLKKRILTYGTVENELMDMAEGGNADGIREKSYSGWTDEHFKKLLEKLGKQKDS